MSIVELAVRSLEDNPVFNSGHGAVLNEAGKIEMDAIIVDGGEPVHNGLGSTTFNQPRKNFRSFIYLVCTFFCDLSICLLWFSW